MGETYVLPHNMSKFICSNPGPSAAPIHPLDTKRVKLTQPSHNLILPNAAFPVYVGIMGDSTIRPFRQ